MTRFQFNKESHNGGHRPWLKPVFTQRHIEGWWRRQPVFRTDGGTKPRLSVHRPVLSEGGVASHHLAARLHWQAVAPELQRSDDPAYTHRCFLPLVDSCACALWEITLSLSYLVPQTIFAAWLHTCDISLKNKTGSYLRFMGRQTLKYLTTLCRQNDCF